MIAYPLSAKGRYIVDGSGRRVKMAGINLSSHLDDMVPGGSDYIHRAELASVLTDLGFNSIRFTFPTRMLEYTGTVPSDLMTANSDLIGATPWQVYQSYVETFTGAGLMVIPNCHLMWPGMCCSDNDGNGLWWNANWPESRFYDAWQAMAAAFSANPRVVGYDLKNEPRKAYINGTWLTPSWGDGNPQTDFQLMYGKAATLIHSVNPDKLIIAEGLNYASDLRPVQLHPLLPADKTVYSLHDYPWFHASGQPYADYVSQMDAAGGYLLTGNIAPVWFGEFGLDPSKPSTIDTGWPASFFQYAAARDLDWCIWHADSIWHQATEPQTNVLKAEEGQWESYSPLTKDFRGVASRKLMSRLRSIM